MRDFSLFILIRLLLPEERHPGLVWIMTMSVVWIGGPALLDALDAPLWLASIVGPPLTYLPSELAMLSWEPGVAEQAPTTIAIGGTTTLATWVAITRLGRRQVRGKPASTDPDRDHVSLTVSKGTHRT